METQEAKAWISVTALLNRSKTSMDIIILLEISPKPSHAACQSQISRMESDNLSLDIHIRKQKCLVGYRICDVQLSQSLLLSHTLPFPWYGLMEVPDKARWRDQLQQVHILTVELTQSTRVSISL